MAGAMVAAAYVTARRRPSAGSLTRMTEPGSANVGGTAGANTAGAGANDYLQTSIHDRQV